MIFGINKEGEIKMTKGYKFKIECVGDGYVFRLYPNNSNTQPIAESPEYKTVVDCRVALNSWRRFVKDNDISRYVLVESFGETSYRPYVEHDNKRLFSRVIDYNDQSECEDWIRIVKENLDAPLKA